jgi:hypothetical protein
MMSEFKSRLKDIQDTDSLVHSISRLKNLSKKSIIYDYQSKFN